MGFRLKEPGLKVLVIDDDRVDRRILKRRLQEVDADIEVDEAEGPGDGMARAQSGDYDCILLDFNFPGGDAFELFDELLAEAPSDRPPIILLTGQGDERIAAESIHRGAQQYLMKGDVEADALRSAIENALEQGREHRVVAARDAELTRLSFYDALTDLPNRRLLTERLSQAVLDAARSGPFVVLMMDLNLFKQVNDEHGHDVGDALLKVVGRRISQVTRESDTVARLGGDEFAAVLSSADSVEGGLVVARKIKRAVAEPVVVGGDVLHVGISVGIALFGSHGDNPEDLLRHADVALYESKGTGDVAVYGGNATAEGREATRIARDLDDVVERRQLVTMYQPQVRLDSESRWVVVGAEALVRWSHPDLGMLPPSKFVPAAERSEVISTLTDHVIRTSLRQSMAWGMSGREIPVSVNLSPRLLERDGLVSRVARILRETGADPATLCLEVTETGISRSPEIVSRVLAGLDELGVRLSIDDFGAGISSLRHLKSLPLDEIKIDGLFVSDLDDEEGNASVVSSIVAIGNAFGARVIAEQVESLDALWRLKELGCPFGQGHAIAPAMAPDDFQRWLGESAREPLG